MDCNNGHSNSTDSKFCIECGLELTNFDSSGLELYGLVGNRVIFAETRLFGAGKPGVLYSDESGIHFETKKGKWTYAWSDIETLEAFAASEIVFSEPRSYFGILLRGAAALENYRGNFFDSSMLEVAEKITERLIPNSDKLVKIPLNEPADISNSIDLVSSLEKLSLLYENDLLSEEEFTNAKRRLLE